MKRIKTKPTADSRWFCLYPLHPRDPRFPLLPALRRGIFVEPTSGILK
jgi:hypothetical protein